MKKYLENSLKIDSFFCIVIIITICLLRPILKEHIALPEMTSITKSMDNVVKVATPLIGFLLTIVSLIVTSKNSFDSQKKPKPNDKGNAPGADNNDPAVPPTDTIFEKLVDKKEIFYDTDIHKKVMMVFLSAVYELAAVVFLFLIFQSDLVNLTRFWAILLAFVGFVLVTLAVFRSFYIYKLFLNVHSK